MTRQTFTVAEMQERIRNELTEQFKEPCPFCGSTKWDMKPLWGEYFFVACLDCKGAGSIDKTPNGAMCKWNTRKYKPEPDPQMSIFQLGA